MFLLKTKGALCVACGTCGAGGTNTGLGSKKVINTFPKKKDIILLDLFLF